VFDASAFQLLLTLLTRWLDRQERDVLRRSRLGGPELLRAGRVMRTSVDVNRLDGVMGHCGVARGTRLAVPAGIPALIFSLPSTTYRDRARVRGALFGSDALLARVNLI
jgi:hypothetical protein